MSNFFVIAALAASLSACAGGGVYTQTGGGDTDSDCMTACLEFRSDGSGCARFLADTADVCPSVVERVCKAAPSSCGNN